MAMHHSDPKRASEAHALPNVEVFEVNPDRYAKSLPSFGTIAPYAEYGDDAPLRPGWYWQPCFPGCLPDGEPNGPFATEQEAVADAQQDHES